MTRDQLKRRCESIHRSEDYYEATLRYSKWNMSDDPGVILCEVIVRLPLDQVRGKTVEEICDLALKRWNAQKDDFLNESLSLDD